MLVFLTFLIALLAACGVLFLLHALYRACLLPLPQGMIHIVPLCGDAAKVERTVRSARCLCSESSGMLLFVDEGIDAQAQEAVALLLRNDENAALCAREQAEQYIRTGKLGIGTGTD